MEQISSTCIFNVQIIHFLNICFLQLSSLSLCLSPKSMAAIFVFKAKHSQLNLYEHPVDWLSHFAILKCHEMQINVSQSVFGTGSSFF